MDHAHGIKIIQYVCFSTEVTYRCSRVVDQEAVDLEILDLACKVIVVTCKSCNRSSSGKKNE